MHDLDKFKAAVNLPASFGEAQPYVRLAYVDESETAGADADVEFDVDVGRVIVTVTEWEKNGAEVIRNCGPGMRRVEFDLATGEVVASDAEGSDETLSGLLVAVSGMKVLGDVA